MAKKTKATPAPKPTLPPKPAAPPKQTLEELAAQGGERFTATVAAKDEKKYPQLSEHSFGAYTYQVNSVSLSDEGLIVEFVRKAP